MAHLAVVNQKGVIVAVNKSWRDFAAANGPVRRNVCEQANYLEACDVAQGEDRPSAQAFAQAIRDVLAGQRDSFEAEYPCHSPEQRRWFIGRVRRLPGKGPPRVMVSHQDITTRKQAELALEHNQTELRRSAASLAEAQTLSEVGSWRVVYKDGVETWTGSDELHRIWGYPPGFNMTMETIRDRFHPHDAAHIREVWAATLRQPGLTEWVHRIVVEGRVKWIHVRISVRRDGQGRALEASGTNQDITARMLAEESLRESEARHRLILDSAGLGIGYFSLQGRLILFNLMAAQQMGGTPAVFAGRYVQDLYGPQMGAVIMTRIGAVIHSETCLEYEDLVALPTGAKWYHSIYSRVRNSQGVVEGVQIISIDITPRKEAEEKAVVQQNAIAHLSRVVTMGELAAGIAHEVNQPLGASLLYAETCRDLLQSGATDAVKLLPALHSLIGQLERARATVTRLKKFIRRQSLTYSTMDVNQVLTESADFLARQIKHARATLIFELAPRPPLVIADTILIQQVVINLIMNALEAMAAAGARIRRLTLGTATAANGACTITVRDTGPGVPAALVGRFFDSFVSGKPQGMGLGLAISRSIVEQLEGRIWYEPAKEGGALFSFTIPAAPSTKKGVSS